MTAERIDDIARMDAPALGVEERNVPDPEVAYPIDCLEEAETQPRRGGPAA